ncbi:plexin-B3 [Amia ocellicauda]|uniref:plexin-B3 n=1 Tax=Amia ocellicauda TaxID=2972642 RepID=UPI0034649856
MPALAPLRLQLPPWCLRPAILLPPPRLLPQLLPLLLLLLGPLPLAPVRPCAAAPKEIDPSAARTIIGTATAPALVVFESPHSARLNHLLLDAVSGQLYVGAVNYLFHLSPELVLLSWGSTGPHLDSPDCLPPIGSQNCPQASETDCANQLLLLERAGGGEGCLIVCGTVLQGICEKRALRNVSEVLYHTANPVDTQYVAANDPRVATVAVLVERGWGRGARRRGRGQEDEGILAGEEDGSLLLLVGRGYTAKGPGGIPPLTTRRLAPSPSLPAPAFSHEDLGKLVVGSPSEYSPRFVAALGHAGHAYFVFTRRNVRGAREQRSYVARVCGGGDPGFYSYVELPLSCEGAAGAEEDPTAGKDRDGGGDIGGFSLARAASLDTRLDPPTLFVVLANASPPPSPAPTSALCAYPLPDLDAALNRAQLLCYSQEGRGPEGEEEAYIEYEVSSQCLRLPQESLKEYPCGGEHTPSPIASVRPLRATPVVTMEAQLSAVVTTTEAGHTIALLGDSQGQLHKVLVGSGGEGEVYDSVPVDSGSAVSADLLLDRERESVYVMTNTKVSKVPVSLCSQHTDCPSCLSARDPYCGWCVLEGRCSRKLDCSLHQRPNHWQWSYDRGNQCIAVETITPANQSREEPTQVSLSVPGLPSLSEAESLSCAFGTLPAEPAIVTGNTVSCQSPAPEHLPPSEPGKDHVSVIVRVLFREVTLASSPLTFYDCGATAQLNSTSPCVACVSSQWGCHWCLLEHRCTHRESCPGQHLIYNAQSEGEPRGPGWCPCVSALLSAALVPVGFPVQLVLLGRNLQLYEGADAGYRCVVELEGGALTLPARLEPNDNNPHTNTVTCQTEQFQLSVREMEYWAPVYLQRGQSHRIDSPPQLHLRLYDCAVGQTDCSQCQAVSDQFGCVWCGGASPSCLYHKACTSAPQDTCPAPHVTQIEPQTGPVEGGISITIQGSNLGQRFQDIQAGVTVAGVGCVPLPQAYLISTRVVCELQHSAGERQGPVTVKVGDGEPGQSTQSFTYQDPQLSGVSPMRGPLAGGSTLTLHGSKLHTGRRENLAVYTGNTPCVIEGEVSDTQLVCRTSPANQTAGVQVRVLFGQAERILGDGEFHFVEDPVITEANPAASFCAGGRVIMVKGRGLDVVQKPIIVVQTKTAEAGRGRRGKRLSQSAGRNASTRQETCEVLSSDRMTCPSPPVDERSEVTGLWFQLDNVRVDFESVAGGPFTYHPNPQLIPLNLNSLSQPYRFKAGGVIAVEGSGLTLAMTREEVIARVGQEECEVKTLDDTRLYCEPPPTEPSPDGMDSLPALTVVMGRLQFSLGFVQYDSDTPSPFPLAAQAGLAGGTAIVVLVVLIVILMYRRKSKQAMRDYKKVLVQLETLEINVGDQCRKEFTDLMTEMMDLNSDLGGPGIPFLEYRVYAERVFFPGQQGGALSRRLELPEGRRATVEQGLTQLCALLNNRTFLVTFIHTLENQQGFSQRDRGCLASLLTLALHDKLEYYTDVMKGLLGDLAEQYVAKNPKLMLRRTETVVEKMLTNWMSICLYSFLREVAGEPLYMLYRAIKYQVDKGPVDAVTGKAKRTLNDSHLLREDIDYCAMTLTVLLKSGSEVQPSPVRVLDTDTITQVKDKILDQVYRGAPFSHRPSADSLDLEWRSGQAGHLTLSDDDVTAVVQGRWKRLNTLQHYKVPDGATVALIPRSQPPVQQGVSQVFQTGEKTPMLEGEEEGGLRLWHLVKSSEEPEMPKHRKSSVRERERAKAIPEIYLTRLLSMKGTLQKFVDDVFLAILSARHPVPIAVRFFFDFLDELAQRHGIMDPDTVHIWKTNSLPLRFWVNILKNPQFVFDVQVPDSVDAVLSVIAQTFIDSCTTSEHKVGRDSPVNKLLYAREIPRYKQLVERYYSDIHSTVSGCYQEMNSTLTELSGSFASEMNSTLALHELYKYINKYYDQIILALEEEPGSQKMQLAYRLQQVAALVENKVTDL